ncbi:MAG TPA: ParB N-terminal domain-containing protein [Bacteroidia bacterium]|jgi:ParB/RepB/Spo0J family partition protein|nr:ParB N-terminal domain-containing protein [Bacteroidia bacterium]
MRVIEVENVDIAKILLNEKNPYKMTEGRISMMAESIISFGIKVPLRIKEMRDNPGYYIPISGNLRHQGAIRAGLKEVPAEIAVYESDDEELQDMLENNRSRKKLHSEIANELLLEKGILAKSNEEGKVREKLAIKNDMSPVYVDHHIAIAEKRKKLYDYIDEKKMSIHAGYKIVKFLEERNVLGLSDRDMMYEVVKMAAPEKLDDTNLEEAFLYAASRLTRALNERAAKIDSTDVHDNTEHAATPTISTENITDAKREKQDDFNAKYKELGISSEAEPKINVAPPEPKQSRTSNVSPYKLPKEESIVGNTEAANAKPAEDLYVTLTGICQSCGEHTEIRVHKSDLAAIYSA